jgi:MoxR-like ATPase
MLQSHTIRRLHEIIARFEARLASVVVAQPESLRLALAGLFAKGHVLIEDVPGVGKTLLARTLAISIDGQFRRIQCTPDLLPADVTGSSVYDLQAHRFEFVPGPLFGNVVLVDEINRASPRTQSALLEAMAEAQVSADGETHDLPRPFFVIATQNPIETAGTYPLPEAQLDRFMLRFRLGYPSFEGELEILDRQAVTPDTSPVVDLDALLDVQAAVHDVPVSQAVKEYVVALARATREHPSVALGASPRGAVALLRAAQAMALLSGMDFVRPDDVKTVAIACLAHRLVLRAHEAAGAESVVQELVASVAVPTLARVRSIA